ncbi:TRAP transporter small permease subunit [Alterinioella nitratireducens]|uniref:TRAP transporter small permease subunit n=1 Tax=Alterinioella nitratireducens TaxID=2735915 RepID=UPI001556751A|nr:TRAP transporter small permease subunit [Alterinioella nitratireducens]NPD21708.1 TRAP transporter small permease subunit [Alterinioella nitratireducens]
MFLIRIIDGLNEVVGRVVAWVAIMFAGLIVYDVVLRYVFHAPTLWAFDLTKQLYGFYFILLGGYALRHQAHVRVDLVTDKLSSGLRRVVELLGYPLFFFPFAWVFAYYSFHFAKLSWEQGETTYGATQLPLYPVKIAMAVAAALLLIQGVSEFLKLILNKTEENTNVG